MQGLVPCRSALAALARLHGEKCIFPRACRGKKRLHSFPRCGGETLRGEKNKERGTAEPFLSFLFFRWGEHHFALGAVVRVGTVAAELPELKLAF